MMIAVWLSVVLAPCCS